MSIDIKGLDHATILASLYNAALPLGMGRLHYTPDAMTHEQAAKLLEKSKHFDYVGGRPLKIFFNGDSLEGEHLYDRDQGDGLCSNIVERLRAASQ